MESTLLDLFTRIFIGNCPGFDVLVLLFDPDVQVCFNSTNYFLRVINFFSEKVIDVVWNVLYFFPGTNLISFLILCFFEKSVDIYLYLVIVLLSFLFGEGSSPVEIDLRHYDVMKLIIVVVIFK